MALTSRCEFAEARLDIVGPRIEHLRAPPRRRRADGDARWRGRALGACGEKKASRGSSRG
jgi:hypothetical protein